LQQLDYRVLALREQHCRVCEERFRRSYALFAHLTYKDVEHPVHEFYGVKAGEINKVHTSSREITNETCMTRL